MTAWLISVAGAGILGVIIEHLTAKTRMHKVVKTACTYVFLLVLIFPLPELLTNGIKMDSCGIFETDVPYDENVLNATDEAYFSIVEASLCKAVKEEGYDVECDIKGRVGGEKAVIASVDVTLHGEFPDSSVVMLTVKSVVADYLEIEQSLVKVKIG